MVGLLAAIDLFILVIPTDVILTSSVMLQPRRWVTGFLSVSTGSALGALALALLLQSGANDFLTEHFPAIFRSQGWEGLDRFLDLHGFWALALISVSPLPQQPGVVVAALSGMFLWEIFLSVWIGRVVKYALFAWLASHAPETLKRFSLGRLPR